MRSTQSQQSTQGGSKPISQNISMSTGNQPKPSIVSSTNKILVHELGNNSPSIIIDSQRGWRVQQAAWSHDNKVIVHCQENDGRISFSKASDGSILKYFQITASEDSYVTDVTYSGDSQFVAFCTSSGQLGMMTLKTKKIEMFQETGHLQNHPLISVSFNKDNEYLASASSDGIICKITQIKFSYVKHYILASAHENGKICIWDTQLRSKKWEVPQAHQTFVTGLAFSPVNNLLLTSCGLDGKIQFYDIQNQKTVKTIYCLQELTFQSTLLQEYCAMNFLKGKKQLYLQFIYKTIDNQNQLSALSFCYDGHTIAVGTTNGNIQVYDLKEKQKIKYELR